MLTSRKTSGRPSNEGLEQKTPDVFDIPPLMLQHTTNTTTQGELKASAT